MPKRKLARFSWIHPLRGVYCSVLGTGTGSRLARLAPRTAGGNLLLDQLVGLAAPRSGARQRNLMCPPPGRSLAGSARACWCDELKGGRDIASTTARVGGRWLKGCRQPSRRKIVKSPARRNRGTLRSENNDVAYERVACCGEAPPTECDSSVPTAAYRVKKGAGRPPSGRPLFHGRSYDLP
jgi:hypothetical protein